MQPDRTALILNYDEAICFSDIMQIPQFYRDVLACYKKVYISDLTSFKYYIANGTIWANKYITQNIGKKKNVLYFRNWIKSGIRVISDINFVNGVLDEAFIYNHVCDQQNIHIEIAILKNALKPYKNELMHMQYKEMTPKNYKTSKQYYVQLKHMKLEKEKIRFNFLELHGIDVSEVNPFVSKVCNEKEIKLKEFNYKLLHNILPCNENLKRWKVKVKDSCDVCQEVQTAKHLLFDCVYVKPLWKTIDKLLDIKVSFPLILGNGKNFQYDNLITLVCFIIYKEWLLSSLKDSYRRAINNFEYLKVQLQTRVNIYKKSTSIDHNNICKLVK